MTRKPSARMLPAKCSLQRVVVSQDASKARVETPVTFATLVPCKVEPRRPDPRVEHGKDETVISHDVFLGLNYSLKVNDRVLSEGRTFQIEGPAEDESGYGSYWVVPCSEVR